MFCFPIIRINLFWYAPLRFLDLCKEWPRCTLHRSPLTEYQQHNKEQWSHREAHGGKWKPAALLAGVQIVAIFLEGEFVIFQKP